MTGPVQLFGEAKFFATSATADRFGGNAVHMLPLTIGMGSNGLLGSRPGDPTQG